jgi:predicted nucleotidyltransferase
MPDYEFWKDWKGKTKLEESAIRSIKAARRLILREIPKEQIIAIYAKGSFIRREMTKKSDVDTLTILKESKFLKKLKKLEEKYQDKYKPNIQFSGLSLWELKHDKPVKSKEGIKGLPSRTLKHIEDYKILYGKKIKKEDFIQKHPKEYLRNTIHAFKHIFLPMYKEKKFGFSQIIKQVFWLVEEEQILKGKNPPHNWKKLARSIKNKNHIIHDALKLRLRPTKDKKIRAKFIKKLNKYLSSSIN